MRTAQGLPSYNYNSGWSQGPSLSFFDEQASQYEPADSICLTGLSWEKI